MSNKTRLVLGILVILAAIFLPAIQERIPDFVSNEIAVDIEEPSEDVKSKTSFSNVVTDDKDRLNLTCFNKVFSDRCINYKATNQDVNDVYVLAAKNFFGDSLNGKYDGYGDSLTKAMKDVIGDEVHQLTEEEKKKLSQTFLGLAWQTSN